MKHIGSTSSERRENGYVRHPFCAFKYTRPRRPWEQPPLVNPQRTYACRHPASFEHDGKLYCNAHAKIIALRVLIDGRDDLTGMLAECATVFRDYERLHLGKEPPDTAKAQRNAAMAARCEAVLKEATP